MKKSSAIIIYLPALHQGYVEFFKAHSNVGDAVFLIGGKLLSESVPELKHLNRDVRAVDALVMSQVMGTAFESYNAFGQNAGKRKIEVIHGLAQLESLAGIYEKVIMPREDISDLILEKIPSLRSIVSFGETGLRWDRNASLLEEDVNVPVISEGDLPENVVSELKRQIAKSVDWWRQVACVIYDNAGRIILATYNRHYPHDLALNIFGDPRFNFRPGEHIENCSAIHAEAWAIAQAARKGIPLKGMNMLVSDFPCPMCAKSIAETGIQNLFFIRGYSKVDGQKTLEDRGIVLKKVLFEQ